MDPCLHVTQVEGDTVVSQRKWIGKLLRHLMPLDSLDGLRFVDSLGLGLPWIPRWRLKLFEDCLRSDFAHGGDPDATGEAAH